jgi:hypothetical protein
MEMEAEATTWDNEEAWIEIKTTIKAPVDIIPLPIQTDEPTTKNTEEIDTELWDDELSNLEIKPTAERMTRIQLKESPIYEDELEDHFSQALKVS